MTSKINTITYAFRRPRFPMICDLNGYLVGAESPTALQRCLAGVDLTTERKVRLVDATGESWMLLPEKMIMAPAFPMGKWRKIEIIRLFNESRNAKEGGRRYPERVIANRRLDTIIRDIAGLISEPRGGGSNLDLGIWKLICYKRSTMARSLRNIVPPRPLSRHLPR